MLTAKRLSTRMSQQIVYLLLAIVGVACGHNCAESGDDSMTAWLSEQLEYWKTLSDWKEQVERECDMSDEEDWRSLFNCPDFSQITCLDELANRHETNLFNCTFVFCSDGKYSTNQNDIRNIYQQHLDTYKRIMCFYKTKLTECRQRSCQPSVGDTEEFATTTATPTSFPGTPTSHVITTQSEVDVIENDGNWTIFQRRQDGSEDFYRNWTDYVNGFGDPEGEFWLGLDEIHDLTKNGDHELKIDMIAIDGTYMHATYRNFWIGSSLTNYTLNIGGYSGNATDNLAFHNHQQFSTYDVDNDKHTVNCAMANKGGWWFRGCQFAHLNGLYRRDGPSTGIIRWRNQLGGKDMAMRFTEMKTRKYIP